MNNFTARLSSVLLILFLCLVNSLSAQIDIRAVGAENVNARKAQGLLTGQEKYSNSQHQASNTRVIPPSDPQTQSSSLCNCWMPRDNTWQIGQFDYQGASGGPGVPPDYRNDDWSTDAITLPFNFCFYGQTVNTVYLNNNGNISIGGTYSIFSAALLIFGILLLLSEQLQAKGNQHLSAPYRRHKCEAYRTLPSIV